MGRKLFLKKYLKFKLHFASLSINKNINLQSCNLFWVKKFEFSVVSLSRPGNDISPFWVVEQLSEELPELNAAPFVRRNRLVFFLFSLTLFCWGSRWRILGLRKRGIARARRFRPVLGRVCQVQGHRLLKFTIIFCELELSRILQVRYNISYLIKLALRHSHWPKVGTSGGAVCK